VPNASYGRQLGLQHNFIRVYDNECLVGTTKKDKDTSEKNRRLIDCGSAHRKNWATKLNHFEKRLDTVSLAEE